MISYTYNLAPGGNPKSSTRMIVNEMRVRIEAHDSGPLVEAVWGHDDYQFWAEVKGPELPALLEALRRDRPGQAGDRIAETDKVSEVYHLLRERYDGDAQAISKFAEFCEQNGIPHQFEMWP